MRDIIRLMKNTDQVQGKQTVLQHGLLVFKYFVDLMSVLDGNQSKYKQKIPTWMVENSKKLKENLADYKSIKHYCIWHDMGKPFCKADR